MTSGSRPRSHALAMWVLLSALVPQPGWATGTAAGTAISNVVTVSYDIGGTIQPPVTSAPATLTVDELIQPTLTWQDGTPVGVNTPGTNDALTFRLVNSGNGQEAFGLARTNGPVPLPAGNYMPANGSIGSIYLESNGTPGFQATDTAYTPGTNDPNLAPDAEQIIYVVSDTPSVAANALGEVLLAAASLTAGAAGSPPGTSLAGLGEGGGFAVVGSSLARADATGSYIASGLGLAVNKTVTGVLDPNGTAVLMPGTVMTYRIAVTLSGAGTVTNLVVADPLPASITYVPGSIAVDGVARTDATDADQAQFSANTVSVSLGNVAAPASFAITFRATIN